MKSTKTKKQLAGLTLLAAGITLGANSWAEQQCDAPDTASASKALQLEDVFDLEFASSLDISDDGKTVYFTRNYMDIHSDKKLGNIWRVDTRSGAIEPVTTGLHNDFSPLLSPDGKRLAYVSTASGKAQIHVKWLDSGAESRISNLSQGPSGLSWSPDSKTLAFSMFTPGKPASPVNLPGKPKGAKWAKPATFIDDVYYRFDGAGFIPKGNSHIYTISADGGNARKITSGDYDHDGRISWSKDGKALYFSASRWENNHEDPLNSELYRVDIDTGAIVQLTDRNGPDGAPTVSPDGKLIAYLGFDDKLTNYENTRLMVMDADGSNPRSLTDDLDRSIGTMRWANNSRGLYMQYDSEGKTLVAYQPLKGKRKILTDALGGTTYGRPYVSADFDVSDNGTLAFTYSDPQRPADIATVKSGKPRVLTDLNSDALDHKMLSRVEEIWYKSSADGRDIQGWIAYPPDFDPNKKYPLILEIHGGPTAAYGPHFSAEVALFAAAGNVVLYTNPRGSSSYGKEFAQTIHHNYPSQDYDDLMSGVDAVIEKGFIDDKQLFVTGGSGGGVLTAWIVGHTDRFAAAVVAKPVINWYSFVLTADAYPFFWKYWFGKKPWEDPEYYMRRSPINYTGNVTTPTMLLTGDADYRTPMSETEQYYQGLKIQGVDTAMVRIPDAPHGIYKRPSNLMSKVAYILWWFDKYKPSSEEKDC